MIVWLILLGIVVLLLGIIAVVKLVQDREDEEVAETASWSEAEATIQDARIEQHDRYHWYPVFSFSYTAGGEYLSGEVCAEVEGNEAHDLMEKLVGTKFMINFDPQNPSSWYIPDGAIEGYPKVFQGQAAQ
jgi:hypothetical protein